MGILPELVGAFVTFLVAATGGWLYRRLLKSREMRMEKSLESQETRDLAFHGLPSGVTCRHNLPAALYPVFVDRQTELGHLLELLSPDNKTHLIGVDGISGVGKTALVVEAAFHCLRTNQFDAIIFVSAQKTVLASDGIRTRYSTPTTLNAIILQTALTFDYPLILQSPPEAQPAMVRAVMAQQRSLLIVDNLETATDKDEVITFLYDLPPETKVIVASRERLPFSSIRLAPLSEQASLELISLQASQRGVTLKTEERLSLYRATGGLPLAIVFAIGQIAFGYSVDSVLRQKLKASTALLKFAFDSSVSLLRGKPAHLLLMTLALLPDASSRETIARVAGLDNQLDVVEDGLAQLQKLSLVSVQDNRHALHPLTRQYVLGELAAHPDFASEAQKRLSATGETQ